MTDEKLDQPAASRPLPPRTQWMILAAAALAALFLFFGLPFIGGLFAPKPPPAAPAPPAGTFQATDEQWRTLGFATASQTNFQAEASTDGKIATNDDHTTQVFSPFSGRVTRVFVKAGDAVRAGQPLFAVQAQEFAQGQTDLQTAVGQYNLTQAAEARQRDLVKSSGAAVKDWQQSQADLATASANLNVARAKLRILGQSDAQIAAMERSGGLKAGAGEAVVASPIGGIVTQRVVGVGQNLASITNGGSTPALVVSDLSSVWLVGNLREADAPKAQLGQAVQVRVPDLPGRVFNATVDFVSPTVDPVTRRVAVRATLPNPGGILKPEMFANFSLATGGGVSAVGVPDAAVIYEGDTARVWVARPNHLLELRQIQAGSTVNGVVEVLSGLKPGEQVVTSGSLFIDRASQGD
jgi:cobalt-zinc-cadmium efflux system membrane fusion protein